MIDLQEFALAIRCEYCKAPPGYWCTTSSGALATQLHQSRWLPVREAWSKGYLAAREEYLSSPDWYARERKRWLKRQGGEQR